MKTCFDCKNAKIFTEREWLRCECAYMKKTIDAKAYGNCPGHEEKEKKDNA